MNLFTIITWPESQSLMEFPWFNECELINSDEGIEKYGSSAYFVPAERIVELYEAHIHVNEDFG